MILYMNLILNQPKDGLIYNVECNAEEGYIIEIEREVDENDPLLKMELK